MPHNGLDDLQVGLLFAKPCAECVPQMMRRKIRQALLATMGIDYDAITMEQFVNLIEVLKLSKHMNSPISQRGKATMTHGKGKRKKR